jgi:surfeit locus 1 family protein
MRRLPLLPTLLVGLAVTVMVALGAWQLQRAGWKERVIAEAGAELRPRAVDCRFDTPTQPRAGRALTGESGYRYLVPCRPGAPLMLDIGWSRRPDALPVARGSGTFRGVAEPGNSHLLVLEEPLPPLERSRRPSAEDIPNNHLLYAIQWFVFALAALIIYALALRRRGDS